MHSAKLEINSKTALIVSIVIAIIIGFDYFRTLCPTVYVGDSGELVTAAWTLGIPHSPGYPLFTLLGYLFLQLPMDMNPAFQMNLLTAIFGVLSIVALFRLIYLLTKQAPISAASSLIVGYGLIMWSQSVTTEVYTLNNLIVCIAIIFILIASGSDRKQPLIWAAFFSGLAFTTHQTSLLILPAGLWLLIKTGQLPLKGKKSNWGLCFLFYLIGLSVYAYLPIAASRNPVMNWGDPSTLAKFFRVLFAPAFTQVNNGNSIDHVFYFFEILFRELTIPGAILALIGLVAAFGKHADIKIKAIGIMFLTYVLFFLFTLRPVYMNLYKLDVYYLPVFILSGVLIASGAIYVLNHARENQQTLSKFVSIAIIFIFVFSLMSNRTVNVKINDRSGNYLAEEYGNYLLDSCDQDSILLCNFDDLFILMYMQNVLGKRDDITTVLAHFPTRGDNAFWKLWHYDQIEKGPRIDLSGAKGTFFKSYAVEPIIEQFIDDNIDSRPVFFTFYKTPPLEMMKLDYRFEPTRFCYRVSKFGQSYDAIMRNVEYFTNILPTDYFSSLFADHHNVEEDFILVRFDELFKFNTSLLKEAGNLKDALKMITLSTDVNPLSWENWAYRSQIEIALGDYNSAIKSTEHIIRNELEFDPQITPFILDWKYEQARIFHMMGDDLTAADMLNTYYKLDNRKPQEILKLAKEVENALAEKDKLENPENINTETSTE